MTRSALLPLPLLALLGAGACSSSDCTDNQNSLPLAAFLTSEEPHRAVTLDSLTIDAIGSAEPVPLSGASVSEAYLPFRIDAHRTDFVLRYREGTPDTVSFSYDPTPWFASHECGVIYKYEMTGITSTRHRIDSVACPGGVITNVPGQNIFIYLRAL